MKLEITEQELYEQFKERIRVEYYYLDHNSNIEEKYEAALKIGNALVAQLSNLFNYDFDDDNFYKYYRELAADMFALGLMDDYFEEEI